MEERMRWEGIITGNNDGGIIIMKMNNTDT
jgi:hypothetical protein